MRWGEGEIGDLGLESSRKRAFFYFSKYAGQEEYADGERSIKHGNTQQERVAKRVGFGGGVNLLLQCKQRYEMMATRLPQRVQG